MHVLRDVLEQAQKKGVAIGHFNIADLVLLKAVFASAPWLGLSTPEEAKQYVEATGIDVLFPGGGDHARHAEEHGAGRDEEAPGYCEDRRDQECGTGPPDPARRIGHRR